MFSVLYIVCFLLTNKIPFLDLNVPHKLQETKHKKRKIESTARSLCEDMDCFLLYDFAQEIYSLEFKEKPDYAKLRFLLTKVLLDQDLAPSNKFDWNNHIDPPINLDINEQVDFDENIMNEYMRPVVLNFDEDPTVAKSSLFGSKEILRLNQI